MIRTKTKKNRETEGNGRQRQIKEPETVGDKDRYRDRQTDRQTDIQTDRQTGRQAGRQDRIDRQTADIGRQIYIKGRINNK